MNFGIIFAIVAMICWGFGDFFIQRSTRKIGDWETLFLITFFGVIIIFPFIWHELPEFVLGIGPEAWIIAAAGIFLFVAALLEFEALKEGKISVIEPTWSLEIPAAAVLASLVLNETLSTVQIGFMIGLIIGLFMVSYRGKVLSGKFFVEKGVMISILAALLMGVTNFFVGWGARETSPLMINFVISLVSLLGSVVFLIVRGKWKLATSHILRYPKIVFPMAILDNIAWIAFAFSMVYAPIGITVALSESYIIIAVLLGIFINKERLEHHQKVGLVLALISAITLAITTL